MSDETQPIGRGLFGLGAIEPPEAEEPVPVAVTDSEGSGDCD